MEGKKNKVTLEYDISASSDDEAPEVVSISTSKMIALSQIKEAQDAENSAAREARDRRRGRDTLLKEQAEARRQRVSAALAELSSGKNKKSKTRSSTASELLVKPTKKIFVHDTTTNGKKGQSEETVEVTPGTKVMVLKEKRLVKLNVLAARKLAKSREALQLVRNARWRVSVATSQAYRRIGLPASQFALEPKKGFGSMNKLLQKPKHSSRGFTLKKQ